MSADADTNDKITVATYLNLLKKADASYAQALEDLSDRASDYKVRCLQAENELVDIIAALIPEVQPSLIREIAQLEPKNALVDTVQSLTRRIKSTAIDRRLLYVVMRQETKKPVHDYASHVEHLSKKRAHCKQAYNESKSAFKGSGEAVCQIVRFNVAHQAKPITSDSLQKTYAPKHWFALGLMKASFLFKSYFVARKLIEAVKQPEGLGDQIAKGMRAREKTVRTLSGYRTFRKAARLAERRIATFESYTGTMKSLHAERATALKSAMAHKAIASYLLADPSRLAGVAQAWPEKQSDRAMQLLGRHAVYSKVQARLIEESLNLKTRQKGLQSEIASKKAMPSHDTLSVNKKKLDRLALYPKHRVSSVIRQIGSVHTKLNANRFTRSVPQAAVGGEGVDGNNLLLGLVAYDMLLGMNDQIAHDGFTSGAATLTGDTLASSEGLAVPDSADNNPAEVEGAGGPPAEVPAGYDAPNCPDAAPDSNGPGDDLSL